MSSTPISSETTSSETESETRHNISNNQRYWDYVADTERLRLAQQRQYQQQLLFPQQMVLSDSRQLLLPPQHPTLLPHQQLLLGSIQEYERRYILPLLPTSPLPPPSLQLVAQAEPLDLSMKRPRSPPRATRPGPITPPDNDSTLGSSIGSSPLSLTTTCSTSPSSTDTLPPPPPNCSRRLSLEPLPSQHPSVKLHPTQPLSVGSIDPEIARMFPHLRSTNMGSIVFWNFLWALLADANYTGVVSWTDHNNLVFRVNHPQALARLWGNVKKNTSMSWEKLMKVIDLYLSKNILKKKEDDLTFQFMLAPQTG